MDDQVRQLAEQLLKTGFDQLSDRERRVITGVAKRTQISRDANRAFEEKLTVGDRLADRVATFGGSWTFITIFLGVLVAWVLLNSVVLASWSAAAFDPYPYIFLNLILSMLAALQAPIIMMSQNRQAIHDRVAAGLDYEVNLKAELEIMALHEKLDQIRSQHLAEMLRVQQEQLRLLTRVLALDGAPTNGTRDQNCLPCPDAAIPLCLFVRHAGARFDHRESCPSVLVVGQSKLVRKGHFRCASFITP
jgi:uncharacterized membrane protein